MDKKDNGLNSKSSPIQMRVLMKRMREGSVSENQTTPKKNLSMRDMLKITRTINERVEQQIDTSTLTGEDLIKSKYKTLVADLEFTKLAKAYENFLKIKKINFEPSNILQVALSSARDLVAEYLQQVKGLDVTGEDVQNFFRSMITKYNNVINEDLNEEEDIENKKTAYDQTTEEEKFRNFFNDMNVSIKLIDLGVYNNLIFWGGTIDGVIQFVYKVTPDENTSGIEFNYLEDFSPDNPENEEIVGRVESYFNTFYKFWRDNVLSVDNSTKAQQEPEEKTTIEFEPKQEDSEEGQELEQGAK